MDKEHKAKEEKLAAEITTEKNKLVKMKEENSKEETSWKGKKTGI